MRNKELISLRNLVPQRKDETQPERVHLYLFIFVDFDRIFTSKLSKLPTPGSVCFPLKCFCCSCREQTSLPGSSPVNQRAGGGVSSRQRRSAQETKTF